MRIRTKVKAGVQLEVLIVGSKVKDVIKEK
jgi:hypothetical protein